MASKSSTLLGTQLEPGNDCLLATTCPLGETLSARLFPNEASCLRLVTAVVMEIAEDWQTAEKRHLMFGD